MVKTIIAALIVTALAGIWVAWEIADRSAPPALVGLTDARACPFDVRRMGAAPILTPAMDARLAAETETIGYPNINGPSLIRVPDWIDNPLGRYYLYFAHHKGDFLRMAYADDIRGPWQVHTPGVLDLADSGFPTDPPPARGGLLTTLDVVSAIGPTGTLVLSKVRDQARADAAERRARGIARSQGGRAHIASPEVVVDDASRTIRLYYHGLESGAFQASRMAVSADGLSFEARPEIIAMSYLRIFERQGQTFGLAMPGMLYRSNDGGDSFKVRRRPLLPAETRHSAVLVRGDMLYVFYTRVGDAPERILCSAVDMRYDDWNRWVATAPDIMLQPELPWEGGTLSIQPSLRGEMSVPVRELRDPDIFEDEGRLYLLYTGAGEQAIGLAELIEER